MRVDFYLLTNTEPEARLLIACRLIEKAYRRDHRVFICCNTQEDAERLDELLWTFKADSFIPHNLQGEGPEPPPPVQIGHGPEPRGFDDLLINLSDVIPPFATRFQRIIEIVDVTDAAKEIGRTHYRTYRDKQYTLHTHPL